MATCSGTNLSFTANESIQFDWQLKSDGQPLDLTGRYFTGRIIFGETIVLEMNSQTATGLGIVSAAEGRLRLSVDHSLVPEVSRTWKYEILMVTGGTLVQKLWHGTISISTSIAEYPL